MISVVCPECGSVGELDGFDPHAESFCRSCDYPLFWAPEAQVRDEAPPESVLRRLPDATGRDTTTAEQICPSCAEPNHPAAVFCRRCAGQLDIEIPPPPRPPDPVTPLEPVRPPDPPPSTIADSGVAPSDWAWNRLAVLLAATSAVLLVALLAVLAT